MRLSHHKTAKLLSCYFKGMPQAEIARLVRMDQSTVSLYASRFRRRAIEAGLGTAGKE